MCDRCATLQDEVDYLRQRLGDRLNADVLRLLIDRFRFTAPEARLIASLYHAKSMVPYFDLESVVSGDNAVTYRDASNVVSVLLVRIRKKAGRDFVVTYRGQGSYALGDAGRRQVAGIIEQDRREVVTPLLPATLADHKVTGWDRQGRKRTLYRLLRVEGLSYSEAGAALDVSRNAVASAARRFGFQSEQPS